MPSLIHDLHDLLASWKAEAQTFDACDMPASALAFRECHRRLSALLGEHASATTAPGAATAAHERQTSVTHPQARASAPVGS
ncbi:hypothetical protein [Xanthomonas hortorum]|uniref:Uncharacterized protein n=1 Tax=Xanthomonas hortorum pv. pelargonii TaxID=453602 RepID=A0A6V7ERE3_9XANT|nr:hypothetical protein [Xanthomonas hortorum]MCE4352402.1 hypothetical protein [Xanthomonas hortorum pv. pelargonii]MCM5524197.1 hypothetical protein [Xanthomonas hortorum pv. pelargonii]MCM5535831.1 hypothetical protein [Xanthomonas hortorum pv. pelargonii]MCM5539895.1 hypothetical protein [Xanthomonas hortorum pv. pelargonii]MCM5546260.1 hypothetical protein [Xanthomonas hortorum pv. pelargonii]